MTQRPVKFQNNHHKTVGVAYTRNLVSTDTKYLFTLAGKMFILLKKRDKKSEDYIQKYAHFQTMILTPVKFQRNRSKTVGGVANTRYLVSIHFGQKK